MGVEELPQRRRGNEVRAQGDILSQCASTKHAQRLSFKEAGSLGATWAAREWVVEVRGQAALGWAHDGGTLRFQTKERSGPWRGCKGARKQEERAVKAGEQGRENRRWRVSALRLLEDARKWSCSIGREERRQQRKNFQQERTVTQLERDQGGGGHGQRHLGCVGSSFTRM